MVCLKSDDADDGGDGDNGATCFPHLMMLILPFANVYLECLKNQSFGSNSGSCYDCFEIPMNLRPQD